MGAYENPQAIIDTQTGEHLRNLQSTIAGSFSNFADSYAKKQAEIKKKLEENEKRINAINNDNEKFLFSLRTDISKLSDKTSQVNLAETFEPLIQEAGRLNLGLLNNTITGQDRQKAMQTLVDIKGTVSGSFSKSLGDIAVNVKTLNEAREKPLGTPGGLAKDQNPVDVNALDIMAGKLPGSKKAVYKDINANKLIWQVYDDATPPNLVREYSAEQLEKMSDLGVEFIKIVPDRTANNESLKSAKPDIFELKSTNPRDPNAQMESTGRITEAFVKKDANEVPITREVEVGQKGSGRYKMVMEADLVKIRENIDDILNSQLAGMTDEELMLHTNNTVNTYRDTAGLDPIYLDSDNVLSPTEKAEAIEAYKDHFVNTQIMREQDVLKEDSSIYIYQKEQPGSSNTESKTKKESKKSQTQILNETVFETPVAERAKAGVGRGTIVKGPNKKYKIADESDGGIAGRWYELDKDGFIIGSPVSEAVVKAQIGYKKTK
jgi:hypothetical protein